MDRTATLLTAATVLVFGLVCAWRGARAPDPGRGPRLAPWRFLMVLAAATLLYLIHHLVELQKAALASGGLG